MNSIIETLNKWGGNFLSFAWPMLWQSGLLIVILFALDFLFRRKVRASIRYALWLVVLLKLILPTTLASPTSPAWWLHMNSPEIKPQIQNYTVTYDSQPLPKLPKNLPAIPPPKPKLTCSAWLLTISICVSIALFVWLLARWREITRQTRRAKISGRLTRLLIEAQQLAGIKFKSNPKVKCTANTISPAVCGLFRPMVLIPQSLAENFSDGQLRTVLLHEAIHLRRGDVWMNFFQSLLQIFYWWHPLLWLANARIRRAREEAVDDAVMLALRNDAETYAPTLLEVAKLAFHRPLISLGLVGIMESRSALRQRIERLVDFRAPRKAGLTFASLFGICVFSAVALPMGQAPTSAPDEFSAAATSVEKPLTLKVNPEVFTRNVKAQANWRLDSPTDDYTKILLDIMRGETVDCSPPHGIAFNAKTGEITTRNTPEQLRIFRQVVEQLNRPDGLFEMPYAPRRNVLIQANLYWMSSDDREKVVADLQSGRGRNEYSPHWIISPEQFAEVNQRIALLNLHPFQRPRIQTADGVTAEFWVGKKDHGVEFDCVPYEADKGLDNGRKGIDLVFRTETIGNPTGPEQELAGTNHYKASGEVGVEDRGGFVVSAENSDGSPTNVVMVIGVQVVTNAVRPSARQAQPQIHIKARFFEVPKGITFDMTNLETLRAQTGVEELAEPEVTTISGRHTQMRATQIITVITNFAFQENATNGRSSMVPQVDKVEIGSVFDVVPTVLDDGNTIGLRAIASVTKFLGYDAPPTNAVGKYIKEADLHLPIILPRFSIEQASSRLKLRNGQTLSMSLSPTHDVQNFNEKFPDVPLLARSYQSKSKPEKELIVFITATLVNAEGNRIHPDN
jgi:beta-lactamase regulating signal transducer with metallopeptidase domain